MAFDDYNLYDFVCFPNRDIRVKSKTEYFDIQKLRLDTEKYTKNNHVLKHKSILNQKVSDSWLDLLDKEINESFIEIMRRINNQLSMSDLTIISLFHYYNEMQQYSIDEEKYVMNEILYRYECMLACYNYYNIQEKYKAIIRVLYSFDPKKTGDNKKFMAAVKKKIKGDKYLSSFYNACVEIANNSDYNFVIKIRTDETHNIPCLDEICLHKKDKNGALLGGVYFVKENKELYTRIKGAYTALIVIKDALQDIIDNFTIM